MSAVDSLPGDQRAVLQLVLGRRRSYDDIARMLSINPGSVRERALAALDSLGPQTRIDQPSRAQISDYLLGQLPEGDVEAVRDRLARSAGERAWARVVSSELAPLASESLPDIPPEAPAERAAPPSSSWSSAMLRGAASVEAARAAEQPPPSEPDRPRRPSSRQARRNGPPTPVAEPEPGASRCAAGFGASPSRRRSPGLHGADGRQAPAPALAAGDWSSGARSSRLGGLIVIGVVVAIVIVGLVVLLSSGSSKKKTNTLASTPTSATSTPAASATPPASASSSTTTTSTTSSAAKVVAQINLTPPAAGSKAAGIAEVLREGTTNGIAIVAQNVPPNTTHPPNAYAVWLYNSPTDAKILGFVNPGVPRAASSPPPAACPPTPRTTSN